MHNEKYFNKGQLRDMLSEVTKSMQVSQSISRAKSYLIVCALSHQVYSSTPSLCSTGCTDQSWPHPMGLPHCILDQRRTLSWNWSGMPPHWRDEGAYYVTWPSCDECETMHLEGHLISRPHHSQAWVLGSSPHFILSVPYYRLMLLSLLYSHYAMPSIIPNPVTDSMHP